MEDILILRDKAELAQSVHWQKIKSFMTDKIVQVSTSAIEPVELKGLLKFIATVDNWVIDYEKEMKKIRNEK